jgi:hypothetical protein
VLQSSATCAAQRRFSREARAGFCGYGAAVLIAVLLFSETTVAKLAGHAITPDEVRARSMTAIGSWSAILGRVSQVRC